MSLKSIHKRKLKVNHFDYLIWLLTTQILKFINKYLAYNDLHEWALESKNSAIQDITSKLTSLYYKMDADLNQDKLSKFSWN